MANSITRRSSTKQGLEDLIRVTAQRSQEDAEELAKEQRRRAREKPIGPRGPTRPTTLTPHNSLLSQDAAQVEAMTVCDTELKASQQPSVEEDEGFSDMTRSQRPLEEQEDWRTEKTTPAPKENLRSEEEKEAVGGSSLSCEASRTHQDEKICVNKKEVKMSYSSTVFMPQDARSRTNGHTADRTSYQNLLTIKPCGLAEQKVEVCGEEVEASSESERRLQEGLRCRMAKLEQGLEELRCRVEEEEQEMGDLDHRWEERCGVNKLEEEHNRIPEEEDRERGNPERRRMTQEVNQEKSSTTLSTAGNEEEQSINPFSPMSPTFKKLLIQFYPNEMEARVTAESTCTITERTECLSRSLKNSTDSVKKTPPPLTVAKIDNRLEQYTHAVKVSSEDAAKQLLTDLPVPTEPVASKKNLFEAGDAWNQHSMKVPLSKDVDSINVGVAELINQWVKGGSDGTKSSSPSKPAEIKPGDVLCKKNLWENLGDAVCSGRAGKGSSSGKRYKFVVTRHGKYEKVAADDDGYNECTDNQPAGQFHEDIVNDTLDP